jgi:branched-chain amino acid aminotransferase
MKSSEPVLFSNNRAFRYSDAVFESIHAYSTEPQFLDRHMDRLAVNMKLLCMHLPGFFTVSNFRQLIVRLLNKNKNFNGAVIRLTVYRNSEEGAIPEQQEVSFALESFPLTQAKYSLNDKGLGLDICNDYTKTTGPLSGLYSANTLLYMLTGLECKNRKLDSLVLLNEAGRIVETFNSNIFMVSGNGLFTPGISQGCIPGIMRSVVLMLAEKANYRINDQSNLTTAALEDAEEVFLTNTVDGIRWIGAYRQKRYFNKTSKQLTALLNDFAFSD